MGLLAEMFAWNVRTRKPLYVWPKPTPVEPVAQLASGTKLGDFQALGSVAAVGTRLRAASPGET